MLTCIHSSENSDQQNCLSRQTYISRNLKAAKHSSTCVCVFPSDSIAQNSAASHQYSDIQMEKWRVFSIMINAKLNIYFILTVDRFAIETKLSLTNQAIRTESLIVITRNTTLMALIGTFDAPSTHRIAGHCADHGFSRFLCKFLSGRPFCCI